MVLTPELLGTGIVGLIIILGAVGNYLRSREKPTHRPDPVLTGIGLAYGDREQCERLITVLTRMSRALDILADRRTDEMEDMHRALLDRLDAQERREEQEEARPRRNPVRRR